MFLPDKEITRDRRGQNRPAKCTNEGTIRRGGDWAPLQPAGKLGAVPRTARDNANMMMTMMILVYM
jgi:hypothetical protein